MAKITFASILSGFRSVSAFDTNFQSIATELNDKVLYRDNPVGEDNVMKNSLDMNSNQILNLPVPLTGTEPVRFDQLTAFIAGGAIPVQEEGTTVTPIPTALNFVGPNITATDVAGVATIITTDTDTFLNLTDTDPSTYTGQTGKTVVVNAGETGLEFSASAGVFRGALVKLATEMTDISSGSFVKITFDAEEFDTDSFHDNVTNNTRLTIPTGVTRVRVAGNIATDNSSANNLALRITKNGSTFVGSPNLQCDSGFTNGAMNVSSGVFNVVATDFLELEVFSADAFRDILVSNSTWFSIEVIE